MKTEDTEVLGREVN